MENTFERAVSNYGVDYVRAENLLRSGGEDAKTTLRSNLVNPDPIAQLLARVLLELIEGTKPEDQKALDYLDNLPRRLARTPVTMPPPTGVATELKERFGDRAAEFLSMRLVKGTDWPRWRALGVILYLQDQRLTTTTAPLIRFAADTKDDSLRKAAIDAIKKIHDPDLQKKVAAERQRLEPQKRLLPPALSDLAPR